MNPATIFHRARGSFSFPIDEYTIRIRLKTGRNEVEDCILQYGDKFNWSDRRKVQMHKGMCDRWHDYWQVDVCPADQRLCYAFQLFDQDEMLWLNEMGFLKTIDEEAIPFHHFEFPFLHSSEVFQPPNWVKDAVFYQIFPERFDNGDPTNDPDGTEDWHAEPTWYNFMGGDLQGIVDRLDYISDLGVNALYLTPVFVSSKTNHKYATEDYLRIDPCFGDVQMMKQLVFECKKRGIRIMLDGVFNHCGDGFAPFQDVLANGSESPYASWFHIEDWPIRNEPRPNYRTFGFEAHMPKLNTQHPEVRRYLLDAVRYWTEEIGIDGWRLDVANEVDHAFWRDFRKVVKGINPDVYILGEVWHDALPWLSGDQFDGVMNYPFRTFALQTFVEEKSTGGVEGEFTRMLMAYPDPVNGSMFNMLGSHDTPRLLTLCGDNAKRMKLALLFQFTFPGIPCLYYGDEIGMTGGGDPDCRRGMIWEEEKQDRILHAYVKQLIVMRKQMKALHGTNIAFEHPGSEDELIQFRRWDSDSQEAAWITLNLGITEVSCVLPFHEGIDALTGKVLTANHQKNGIELCIPPYEGVVVIRR